MSKYLILSAAILLSTAAYAAGPEQGTFAGQTPRGQQVSANAQRYNEAGSNYGQAQVTREVNEPGGRDDDVQGNIGLNRTVGYGSNK